MKNSALIHLVSIASLHACSSEPKSKKQQAPAPVAYVETLPQIAENASNVDGGAILGKAPPAIAVSPIVTPRINLTSIVDLKTYSIAGVGLSNTLKEVIDLFGPARIVTTEDSNLYIFDDRGIVMGIPLDSPEPLASKPDVIFTMQNFQGVIAAPENLGDLRFGKKIQDGKLTSLYAISNLARALGAYAHTANVETYDCFAEGTCASGNMQSGSRAIVLPHALIQLSPSGVLTSIQLDQEARGITKVPAPLVQTIRYGMTIGGLSFNAKAKDFANIFGSPTVEGNFQSYADQNIITQWSASGDLVNLYAQGNAGLILAADGSPSTIQLNVPVTGEFTCANILAQSVAGLDPEASPDAVTCKLIEKAAGEADTSIIAVELPGAALQYMQFNDPETNQKTAYLAAFSLRLRPVIYGDSIAGIKLGYDEAQVAKLYGPLPPTEKIKEDGRIILTSGLAATFTAKDDKLLVSKIEAFEDYRALVRDSNLKVVAQVGTNNSPLSFSSDLATVESFKFFAQTLESGIEEVQRRAGIEAGLGIFPPAFNAEKSCSLVPEKTATCYFLSSTGEDGAKFYTVVLPHMSFQFDDKHVLNYLSL